MVGGRGAPDEVGDEDDEVLQEQVEDEAVVDGSDPGEKEYAKERGV